LSGLSGNRLEWCPQSAYNPQLAGISAGFAYGAVATKNGVASVLPRLLRRIAQLYSAHLALLWIAMGVLTAATLVFEKDAFIGPAVSVLIQTDLRTAAWSSLALVLQPAYFDILPLYVTLLLMLPLFLLLERVHPGMALVLSIPVWAVAEATGLNLPSSRSPVDGWTFDPFAWQLLFCVGLVGAQKIRRPPRAIRSRWLIAMAIAYAMLAFAVTTPCRFRIATNFCLFNAPQSYVVHLTPLRLAHGLALAYLAMIAMPDGARWLSQYPARAFITLGQNSLWVFCVGSLLSLVGAIALAELGTSWRTQLLLNTAGIGLLFATARPRDRRGSFPPKPIATD
jgi:hypothetical protein